MISLLPMALVLAPLAAPALAQSRPAAGHFVISRGDLPRLTSQRNFDFRVSDSFAPDGSRRKRTAIIAGVDVAPGTIFGVGLFDSMPKARGRGPDPRLDGMAKKSRKAAVGMTFRF